MNMPECSKQNIFKCIVCSPKKAHFHGIEPELKSFLDAYITQVKKLMIGSL